MNQFDAYHAKLLIVPSGSNIGSVLSDQIMLTCRAALYKRNKFTIALSGGSVPKLLQNLSQHFTDVKFDPQWEKWHVLLADERCVVSTHEDSNLNSIRCNFTNDVPIPIDQVYGIDESLLENESTDAIAAAYEEKVVKPILEQCDGMLDCVVLGFGEDGHTCSLFPNHSLVLKEETRLVAPIDDSPKPPSSRITLTFNVLNKLSRRIIFCGVGLSKRPILEAIFENTTEKDIFFNKHIKKIRMAKADMVEPAPYPCGMVRPVKGQYNSAALIWIVDDDAQNIRKIYDKYDEEALEFDNSDCIRKFGWQSSDNDITKFGRA